MCTKTKLRLESKAIKEAPCSNTRQRQRQRRCPLVFRARPSVFHLLILNDDEFGISCRRDATMTRLIREKRRAGGLKAARAHGPRQHRTQHGRDNKYFLDDVCLQCLRSGFPAREPTSRSYVLTLCIYIPTSSTIRRTFDWTKTEAGKLGNNLKERRCELQLKKGNLSPLTKNESVDGGQNAPRGAIKTRIQFCPHCPASVFSL